MIKRLAVLFFALALGCIPALPAKWLPLIATAGGGGASPPTIDPNANAQVYTVGFSSSTVVFPSFSTTNSNDVINACVQYNASTTASMSGGGLTWTQVPGTDPTYGILCFYAIASSPLSGVTITITSTGASYVSGVLFGVSGANTAAPLDASANIAGGAPISITTTNPNTMILGIFRVGDPTPTVGSGFTQISASSGIYFLAEYIQQTGTVSGFSVTTGADDPDVNGMITYAIKH